MSARPMPHCTGGSCQQGHGHCTTPAACGLPIEHDEGPGPLASRWVWGGWLAAVGLYGSFIWWCL